MTIAPCDAMCFDLSCAIVRPSLLSPSPANIPNMVNVSSPATFGQRLAERERHEARCGKQLSPRPLCPFLPRVGVVVAQRGQATYMMYKNGERARGNIFSLHTTILHLSMARLAILFASIVLLSEQVLRVAAHGFVHSVVIGGVEYPAYNPFSDGYNSNAPPRVTRKIGSDGPGGFLLSQCQIGLDSLALGDCIVSDSDADLACHRGGDVGTGLVAEAAAGSDVVFNWVYWPGGETTLHSKRLCTECDLCVYTYRPSR